MKTYFLIVAFSFFSATAFSQGVPQKKSDTSATQKVMEQRTVTQPPVAPMYMDTRLGSSSPMYDTYQKNDDGAGAITNNPNKSGGGGFAVLEPQKVTIDSLHQKITSVPPVKEPQKQ